MNELNEDGTLCLSAGIYSVAPDERETRDRNEKEFVVLPVVTIAGEPDRWQLTRPPPFTGGVIFLG